MFLEMEPIIVKLMQLYSQRQWVVLILVPVLMQTIYNKVASIREAKMRRLTKIYLAGKIARVLAKTKVTMEMMAYKRRNNFQRSKR